MAERLKALVLKTSKGESSSQVRILFPPLLEPGSSATRQAPVRQLCGGRIPAPSVVFLIRAANTPTKFETDDI